MRFATRIPRLGAAPSARFRPGVLALAAAIAVFLVAFRRVEAQVDEAMLGLGDKVMAFPDLPLDAPRSIQVNGVVLSIRTQIVDSALPQVLDHHRGLCSRASSDSGALASLISGMATRSGATEDQGYVACVTPPSTSASLDGWVHRLARFAETANLADVGVLHYVYVTRANHQPERRSFVLTMWADAAVDLRAMLPHDGHDAAGTDLAGVPRPPRSQRVLSATELSEPTGVFVYLTPGWSPSDIVRTYRNSLARAGWDVLEDGPVLFEGSRMMSAERGRRLVTVVSHPGDSGVSVLTLLASEVQ